MASAIAWISSELRDLGLPFWLEGGYGSPERLREALDAGAAGVQVGTAFALCAESGLRAEYRTRLLRARRRRHGEGVNPLAHQIELERERPASRGAGTSMGISTSEPASRWWGSQARA